MGTNATVTRSWKPGDATATKDFGRCSPEELAQILEDDDGGASETVAEAARRLRAMARAGVPATLGARVTRAIIEDRWSQATGTTERTPALDWAPVTSPLYDRLESALSELAAILVSYEVPGEDVDEVVAKIIASASDQLVDWALAWYAPKATA